jgi:glycosyltransferase involved in cell wall biosynthesis
VTSSNLACNPRLLKELDLACRLGHKCTVIQFLLGNWSDDKSKLIQKKYVDVEFVNLSALRNPFLQWINTSIMERIFCLIPRFLLSIKYLAFSLSKRSILLDNEIKKLSKGFDWVIAHNPPAFYPAHRYAVETNCKLGFDIEDYHPGEGGNKWKSRRMLLMMLKLLPTATYCSFAAPLIQKEVERHYKYASSNWFTVINGFPQSYFVLNQVIMPSKKLKLIWFSQNIAPGRGLEKFVSVLCELNQFVELHLVGSLSPQNMRILQLNNKGIVIHEPMDESKLFNFLSSFDIGLALEPGKDFNNSIAVSNKMIAYAQAGLFIISTRTIGQVTFLENSGLRYEIIENDEVTIKNCLLNLFSQWGVHKWLKKNQFEVGKKYSWESVNSKILTAWER